MSDPVQIVLACIYGYIYYRTLGLVIMDRPE